MPRFFFHSEDGERFTDEEGVDLHDPLQARREAVRTLGELLKARGDDFWTTGTFRLIVTDATGVIYYTLDVAGVETPASKPSG